MIVPIWRTISQIQLELCLQGNCLYPEFFAAVECSKERTNRTNQERPTENLFFSPQNIYCPYKIRTKPIEDAVTRSCSMLVRKWGTFSLTHLSFCA